MRTTATLLAFVSLLVFAAPALASPTSVEKPGIARPTRAPCFDRGFGYLGERPPASRVRQPAPQVGTVCDTCPVGVVRITRAPRLRRPGTVRRKTVTVTEVTSFGGRACETVCDPCTTREPCTTTIIRRPVTTRRVVFVRRGCDPCATPCRPAIRVGFGLGWPCGIGCGPRWSGCGPRWGGWGSCGPRWGGWGPRWGGCW